MFGFKNYCKIENIGGKEQVILLISWNAQEFSKTKEELRKNLNFTEQKGPIVIKKKIGGQNFN